MGHFISQLVVTRRPGAIASGRLQAGSVVLPCSLGRHGVTRRKREGDGKTPLGQFSLKGGFLRRDRLATPPSLLGLKPSRAGLGWCDDVGSPNYNRLVRLPTRDRHETLQRDDALYDVVIVLDYNLRPRIRAHGSAIFLHVSRGDCDPTAGCVAISREAMRRLVPRLARQTRMIIR